MESLEKLKNAENKTFRFLIASAILMAIDTLIPNKDDLNPLKLNWLASPVSSLKPIFMIASFITFIIGLYFAIKWLLLKWKLAKNN